MRPQDRHSPKSTPNPTNGQATGEGGPPNRETPGTDPRSRPRNNGAAEDGSPKTGETEAASETWLVEETVEYDRTLDPSLHTGLKGVALSAVVLGSVPLLFFIVEFGPVFAIFHIAVLIALTATLGDDFGRLLAHPRSIIQKMKRTRGKSPPAQADAPEPLAPSHQTTSRQTGPHQDLSPKEGSHHSPSRRDDARR